jgi:hypothetical protein
VLLLYIEVNLIYFCLWFRPTFLYRVGSNNCYACHHMLNVTRYCALLEQEYLPCHWFPAFLWHNWSTLLLSFSCQVSWRCLGPYHSFFHIYGSHVCLALWHNKEVRVRCAKQGISKLALKPWSFTGHCPRSRHWANTYGTNVWNSSHFLPLCHQSACVSPGISSHVPYSEYMQPLLF